MRGSRRSAARPVAAIAWLVALFAVAGCAGLTRDIGDRERAANRALRVSVAPRKSWFPARLEAGWFPPERIRERLRCRGANRPHLGAPAHRPSPGHGSTRFAIVPADSVAAELQPPWPSCSWLCAPQRLEDFAGTREPRRPAHPSRRLTRPMVSAFRVLVGLVCSVTVGWMALAIYFDFSLLGPPWLRAGLGVLVAVGAVAALWLVRSRRWTVAAILGVFVVVLVTWLAILPSNERDWQPDVATLAFADIRGDRVIVHNVRNAEYRTETDYTVRLEDRTLDLTKLRSLDMFLVHWGLPLIAHTILSWGFEGDRYLAISIETRKEAGEQYSALRGFFRQYELVFVVADERDVVRLRTNFRGEDVHVYRLDVTAAEARELLLRYLHEVNELRERPQWYNALTDNCTTAIQRLARVGARRSWWSWKLFLNGYLDELAYDIGAIDRSLPFSVLRAKSHVNERAKAAADDPRFSVRIREGLPRMSVELGGAAARR
jgi:hypothetical protein